MTTTILWFRRDLRLADHPALCSAASTDRLVPLFVLDERLLGPATAGNRLWFMLESLRALDEALRSRGSRLHVRRGSPETIVPQFARDIGASAVHASRDYAPYGRERDRAIAEALAADGVALHRHAGVLVHEPEAIAATDGRPYTVYSPFRRAWDRLPIRGVLEAPEWLPPPPDHLDPGSLPSPDDPGFRPTADPDLLPEPGEGAARRRLERWLREGVEAYAGSRDRLGAQDGTSRLSQDLRFGLLSPTEVAARADGSGEGRRRFVAELCWRDFYAHVLWHEPELRRRSFRPAMDAAFRSPDATLLEAWASGRTGYPVVDAAMRQLAVSGWMHNRARMVAASFLTKHLLIDRRVGEAHFWRHLVDGDLASNNGGWQWAASTGTDPQPYFRIFNPVLQGRRFDADGTYVRRWLPELAAVPPEHIHAPWLMPPAMQEAVGCRIGVDYPAPIVDHAEARSRALAALSTAGSPGPRPPADGREAAPPETLSAGT